MLKRNFKFIRGDTFTYYFSLPILYSDISKIYYTVKQGSNGKRLIQKSLDNDILVFYKDAERIHYVMTIQAEDTDNLKVGMKYNHDIEVIYDSYKETVMKGEFVLEDEVTKPKDER